MQIVEFFRTFIRWGASEGRNKDTQGSKTVLHGVQYAHTEQNVFYSFYNAYTHYIS